MPLFIGDLAGFAKRSERLRRVVKRDRAHRQGRGRGRIGPDHDKLFGVDLTRKPLHQRLRVARLGRGAVHRIQHHFRGGPDDHLALLGGPVYLCPAFRHHAARITGRQNLGVLFDGQQVDPALCVDPQTSGGLLIGIAPDRAEALLASLRDAGGAEARVVGRVVAAEAAEPRMRWAPAAGRAPEA